jgi:hypothetical protein
MSNYFLHRTIFDWRVEIPAFSPLRQAAVNGCVTPVA